jgi:thioredoxin 1
MSPVSPVAWKLIAAAGLVIAVGLLYTCPSRGQCPLVQLFSGGSRPSAPESLEALAEPAAKEPAEATAQVQPNPNSEEGEPMSSVPPKPQPGGEVLHADLENFEQLVLESEVPVLVDFYADWCRPCQMLAPALDDLARESPDARIVKVNVDESPELAGHFGVSSIPALMVFKDGNLVAKRLGVLDKNSLKQLLGG